jgi:hypothetical protein
MSLQQALRFSRSAKVRRLVRAAYSRWQNSSAARPTRGLEEARRGAAAAGEPVVLSRSLLLKAPAGGGEKGVILLGTEGDWGALVASGAVAALKEECHLVAMAASAAPPLARLHALAATGDGPLHFGIGNDDHYDYAAVLGSSVVPLPIMGCDWLDPAAFSPRPRHEREIDILMVASWLQLKRHWLAFKALRSLPSGLHVVMVGGPAEGRELRDIKEEARAWGVRQDIVFLESIPNEEVYRLQCNSRIALQLSRREGPCVAVVEAMMADTPVAMMRDSYAGATRYINDRTGTFLDPQRIGRQLAGFLETSEQLNPRPWIARQASYTVSLRRLEAHFESFAQSRQLPWRDGLVPVTRRHQQLRYVNAADAQSLGRAAAEIGAAHGLRLGSVS